MKSTKMTAALCVIIKNKMCVQILVFGCNGILLHKELNIQRVNVIIPSKKRHPYSVIKKLIFTTNTKSHTIKKLWDPRSNTSHSYALDPKDGNKR